MRWIRRLLHRRPKPTPRRTETPGQREAQSALIRSRDAREELEANRAHVDKYASRLARERERNHFAELFRASMEGGHH